MNSGPANLVVPTALVPMAPAVSSDENLVFIKGYMSERYTELADSNRWVRDIRAAGFQGAIYQLQWDSGRAGELLRSLGATMLLRLGASVVKRRVFLPLPALGVYELTEIRRHWTTVSRRADVIDASAMLDLVRHEMKSGSVTLLGHSLGAKIAFNMLRRGVREKFRFKDAVMMGGALPRRGAMWHEAAGAVDRSLLNVHHSGDWVLGTLYKFGEFTRYSPCGLKPVEARHASIRNVDASQWLGRSFRSHIQYGDVIGNAVGRYLWSEAERPVSEFERMRSLPAVVHALPHHLEEDAS